MYLLQNYFTLSVTIFSPNPVFYHVFRHNRSNVKVFFHLFENQDCHTIQVHMLAWL